jgi:hypothetical protein
VVLPGLTPRKLAGSIESVGISSGVAATGAVTLAAGAAAACGCSATGLAAIGGCGCSAVGLATFAVGLGSWATRSLIQRLRTPVSGPVGGLGAAGAGDRVAGGPSAAATGTSAVHGVVPPRPSAVVTGADAVSARGAGAASRPAGATIGAAPSPWESTQPGSRMSVRGARCGSAAVAPTAQAQAVSRKACNPGDEWLRSMATTSTSVNDAPSIQPGRGGDVRLPMPPSPEQNRAESGREDDLEAPDGSRGVTG